MDFFKALRKRAFKPYQDDEGYTVIERAGILGVIDATIEALKEMMVREPIKGKIWHCNEDDLEFTRFVDEEFDELIIAMDHIGTDGEEVAMIVLRCDKQKKQKG